MNDESAPRQPESLAAQYNRELLEAKTEALKVLADLLKTSQDPAEARRIGLVHQVVPAAELEAAGARIVAQILQNGPEAIAQTKVLALQSAWAHLDEPALTRLIELHADKRQSAEAAEGLASFAQKRAARWT